MATMDLGGGWQVDTESGQAVNSWDGDRRQATPEELQGANQYFASPEYVSGSAEAARQHAADHDFDWGSLIKPAIGALTIGAFTGGLGAFDLFGGAGAADAAAFEGAGGIDFSTGLPSGTGGAAAGAGGAGGALMPGATPETAASLAAQGLTQTGPGAWSDLGTGAAAGGAAGGVTGSAAGGGGGEPATAGAVADAVSPAAAGGLDTSGFGSDFDASGMGTGSGPTFSGAGGGGADFIPGSDTSIYTGEAPTDVPNPVPDETIKPAASAAAGAGGVQGALDKLMKYGPLGMQGFNMLNQKAQTKKYSKEFGQIGATQRDIANQMIADAKEGKINPADQYAIDQWKANAIAQMRAYYAKAGISDSSMATKAEADINAKATAMAEQARQTLLQTGITTLNVVDKYAQAAITAEMQGDQAAAKQATDFLSSYGQWLRTLPTMTGQPGTGTKPAGTAAVPA